MPSRRIRRIMGNDVEQILTQSRPCASELCARDEESCLRRDCHVRMRIEHEPQQCCAGPRGTDDDRHGWITGSSPLHQPLESLPHQNSPFRWLAGRVLTLWTAPCRPTGRSRRYLCHSLDAQSLPRRFVWCSRPFLPPELGTKSTDGRSHRLTCEHAM